MSPLSIYTDNGVLSKSELIRKYAVTYPNSRPIEIAKATGAAYKYVNQVLWAWRNKQKDIKLAQLHELAETPKQEEFEFGNSNVDLVNHPPHYTHGGIETIDFIEAKGLSYNLGNVIKYVTRSDHKGNKLQDLMKARWYLEREINKVT